MSRIKSSHDESHHINSNEVESNKIESNPTDKYDYSREGRTNSIIVTIIDERGNNSAPKSLQMVPSDPPKVLLDRVLGSGRVRQAEFQTVSNGMPVYERRAHGGRPDTAPNPWTPKPKREPSSESFREKHTQNIHAPKHHKRGPRITKAHQNDPKWRKPRAGRTLKVLTYPPPSDSLPL